MQNNDYISRSDVLAQVEWIGDNATWDNLYPEGVSAVTEENIESIPAADVRPVGRGEWAMFGNPNYSPFDGSEEHVYQCTNCKSFQFHKTNFCPNCGADMRGEGE